MGPSIVQRFKWRARALIFQFTSKNPYCAICQQAHTDWVMLAGKAWFCQRCFERDDEPTPPAKYSQRVP